MFSFSGSNKKQLEFHVKIRFFVCFRKLSVKADVNRYFYELIEKEMRESSPSPVQKSTSTSVSLKENKLKIGFDQVQT